MAQAREARKGSAESSPRTCLIRRQEQNRPGRQAWSRPAQAVNGNQVLAYGVAHRIPGGSSHGGLRPPALRFRSGTAAVSCEGGWRKALFFSTRDEANE